MSTITDKIKIRLDINNDSDNYQYYNPTEQKGLDHMQKRLNSRGGTDQWVRMREDKLRGLKKSLLSSYQSAIVQKYDVNNNTLANNLISIITLLQDKQELSQSQNLFLDKIEQQYSFILKDRTSISYINQLNNIVNQVTTSQPLFRCLINHDKLKVDYEDKIISIPFEEPPIGSVDPIETNFHNGTVFKWVHGNKEDWTPNTYWIVYMQYSEETAYFRAEIRKADEQIEIITIDDQGNENSVSYRGWMTGPNETSVLWNTKRGVTWNDMNYTKLLYITKDENTLAFFQRFDRIIINGKPWQVQAYNESYSTSKNKGEDSGIIRVALKETYVNSTQFVKEKIEDFEQRRERAKNIEPKDIGPYISGPTTAKPYQELVYIANNFTQELNWTISDSTLAKFIAVSQDGTAIKIKILSEFSNSEGFDINYGDSQDTIKHITIESL